MKELFSIGNGIGKTRRFKRLASKETFEDVASSCYKDGKAIAPLISEVADYVMELLV